MRLIPRAWTQPFFKVKWAFRVRTATVWRRRLAEHGVVVVGITGSHGKSTTSALLGAMLGTLGPTLVGSHWNMLGEVTRNVRAMRPQHRFLVQEAGFSRPGSIAEMARVLQPTVAVVTALGGDHRKAVGGSRERLAEEKGKLVEALPAGGLVVLDADDPLIAGMAALRPTARAVFFGRSERADLRLLDATAAWPDRLRLRLSYRGEVFSLATRFVSEVNALAVMAAMLTALELGVDRRQCEAVVAGFEPLFDKLSVHAGQNGEWYVLDATKGSHQGLEACLGFLAAARAPRKTVVFGTLADYAGASRSAYHKAARLALAYADRVFFTGANAFRPRRLATGEFADRILMVEDPARLLSELRQSVVPGELIYVKAALVDQLASVFSSALAVKPPTIRKRQRTILG